MAINITVPFSVLADDIEEEISRKYRGFLLVLFNNLTLLSPVDTGRYRANHMMTIGSPSYAIDSGTGFVAPPTSSLPSVYFQNNLPYAVYLEVGTPKMAPRAVYQRSLDAALASF